MILLQDLRNATGGQLFGEIEAEIFDDFCHDPQHAEPGKLFVVLRPAPDDGQRYIEQAIKNGVSGVLCEQPPTCDVTGVTVVIVGDTSTALAQWATYILRQYNPTVVGVAGELGKSSTIAAITAVLGTQYSVYCGPDTVPGREGLALSLGGLQPENQVVVLEYAAANAEQMSDLLSIVQPYVAVITRLDSEVGSAATTAPEDTIRPLLEGIPDQGAVILNGGDDRLRALIPQIRFGLVTFANGYREGTPDADLVAVNVQYFVDKVGFDLAHRGGRLKGYWTPALGEPGLTAALAALAVGLVFEIPLAQGLYTLKQIRPLPGRLMLLDALGGAAMIDNTYHATPASIMASLDLLSRIEVGTGRRILVLGATNQRDEQVRMLFRAIGQHSSKIVDHLLVVGELAGEAMRAAREAGAASGKYGLYFRQEDVADVLRDLLRPDDVLVVVGDRTSGMERVCAALLANPEDGGWLVQRQAAAVQAVAAARQSPTWVELDLDALAHNVREVCRRVGSGTAVIAVVRSYAYGHGLIPIAVTALHNGASVLAVSSIDDGISVRDAGIKAPMLILGAVPSSGLADVVAHDLAVTVTDRGTARALTQIAWRQNRTARIHVKVDTGTGDLGLLPQEVVPLLRELIRLDGLKIEGLYTRFAAADTLMEAAATQEQLRRFRAVVDSIRATGVSIPYIHAADSAAILTLPASYFTAVRAGIAMYGLHPSVDVPCPTSFRRVLSWKTQVVQVRSTPPDWIVGARSMPRDAGRTAVIPVGFGEGFSASPRNWGEVLIGGERVPILGRVEIGHSVVSVGHLPEVQVGDEVVLLGRQGREEITAEDIARRLDTTNYEVVTRIAPHIPRLIREDRS